MSAQHRALDPLPDGWERHVAFVDEAVSIAAPFSTIAQCFWTEGGRLVESAARATLEGPGWRVATAWCLEVPTTVVLGDGAREGRTVLAPMRWTSAARFPLLDGVLEVHATDAVTCQVRLLASYRQHVSVVGEVRPFGFGEIATSTVATFLRLVAAHLQHAALSAGQVGGSETGDGAPTEAASATSLVTSSSTEASPSPPGQGTPRPPRRRGRRRRDAGSEPW